MDAAIRKRPLFRSLELLKPFSYFEGKSCLRLSPTKNRAMVVKFLPIVFKYLDPAMPENIYFWIFLIVVANKSFFVCLFGSLSFLELGIDSNSIPGLIPSVQVHRGRGRWGCHLLYFLKGGQSLSL